MIAEPGYKERRISEISKEIAMIEDYLENSKPSKTAEWGSGTFKKRKNKQYSNLHSTRISEMEDRLNTLKQDLNKWHSTEKNQ